MAPAETLEFLSVAGRELFAVRNVPPGPARGAVVCCQPFAEEKKSAHRTFYDLALRLAEKRIASIRLDFFGCGDSDGFLSDATTELWIQDIAAALDHLADSVPAEAPRFMVGLRLGASLAALCAAEAPGLAGLVLWQPVVNGRKAFAADLRRTLIKQMLTNGAGSVTRDELLARLESGEGRIDLDGFDLTGALYRGIAAIDLAAQDSPFAGPVLIAQMSHAEAIRPEIQRVADLYRDNGADVSVEALVSPPIWARIERTPCPDLLDRTVAWIEARAGGPS